jgi:hypothetical protein
MRFWTLSVLIVGVLSAFWAEPASSQTSSTECCYQLLFPIGARAVSLGQTLTARSSRDGLFYNPASLAGNGQDVVAIHYEKTLLGANTAFSLLVDAGLAGAFGFTLVYIDQGQLDATDEFGQVIGTLTSSQQQAIVTYATPVRAGLRAGASLRFFHDGTACRGTCEDKETSGWTPLVDLGVQWRPPVLRGLELGAAITHAGRGFQVHNAAQADPTPARIRAGAAYEVAHHVRPDSLVTLWLSADIVHRLRSQAAPVLGVGAELAVDRTLYLRAGYTAQGDGIVFGGGSALGLGIHYQRYTVDIGQLFTTAGQYTDGRTLLISIGITF